MTSADDIRERTRRLLESLPPGVTLVAAAKSRTPAEVNAAIEAGVTAVGHNYVQEAERMIGVLGRAARWHMIGHLQRNKSKRAVALFDMVETVDSMRLAAELDRRCAAEGQVLPVLLEVNSGREESKTGVWPEDVGELAIGVAGLQHLRLEGLMTMGPRTGAPEEARPFFRATRRAFERLAATEGLGAHMRHLSMGMSNSWRVAIEEGATIIRVGTALFEGPPTGSR